MTNRDCKILLDTEVVIISMDHAAKTGRIEPGLFVNTVNMAVSKAMETCIDCQLLPYCRMNVLLDYAEEISNEIGG